jgi:hypothetical protein
MKMSLYRGNEILRESRFLPASAYNLAHTLLAHSDGNVFVPIRTMQYLAIVDKDEIVFVDRELPGQIQLAWQFFRPQSRTSLEERVPYEVAYYQPGSQEIMLRLQAEFPRAMQQLNERNRPAAQATILDFREHDGSRKDGPEQY